MACGATEKAKGCVSGVACGTPRTLRILRVRRILRLRVVRVLHTLRILQILLEHQRGGWLNECRYVFANKSHACDTVRRHNPPIVWAMENPSGAAGNPTSSA